jgi:chemotaxis protein MotA
MDPGTLVGIFLGFGAVFGSVVLEGGNPMSIFLPGPLLLVFVGTFGAGMAGGHRKDATGVVKGLKVAFTGNVSTGSETVDTIVSLAERARKEGLLALEDAARQVDEPFLRRGLELAIDGTDPEELREILDAEIDAKRRTDRAGAKLFTDMGAYAPTIGIIGTVTGLVHVLENLSAPEELGHLIAGAFVATLWGVMSANLIWLPLGNKIKRISELQCQQLELLVEGIMSIQAGASPRVVARRLRSLLPPDEAAGDDEKAA